MTRYPQRLRVRHGELRQCGQPSTDEKGITNISWPNSWLACGANYAIFWTGHDFGEIVHDSPTLIQHHASGA